MLTFSTFTSHYSANVARMPPAEAAAIRRAAVARLADRWRAGRGDVPLCFADLCERIETAVAPRVGA
jgi:hypothetical protein